VAFFSGHGVVAIIIVVVVVVVVAAAAAAAGMGTRRKSSRPRRDRDAYLTRPRRDVCSSQDVIETLKYKLY